jgi:hypothetical protein
MKRSQNVGYALKQHDKRLPMIDRAEEASVDQKHAMRLDAP